MLLAGVTSHYERIRAQNPAIRGHRHNNAVSGAKMANVAADRQRVVQRELEFNRALVSRLDYFHPSLLGQATLAAETWQAPL